MNYQYIVLHQKANKSWILWWYWPNSATRPAEVHVSNNITTICFFGQHSERIGKQRVEIPSRFQPSQGEENKHILSQHSFPSFCSCVSGDLKKGVSVLKIPPRWYTEPFGGIPKGCKNLVVIDGFYTTSHTPSSIWHIYICWYRISGVIP